MARKDSDRVQREIEELLDKLDNFVPEDRLVSKIKKRRKDAAGPSAIEQTWTGLGRRLSRITLGHVMLFGLALTLVASFAPGLLLGYSRPAFFVGLLLLVSTFVISFINRDSQQTITGGRHVQRRWRGQVIDYDEPGAASRFREWLRGRRRK
jgi:hypothetical protein